MPSVMSAGVLFTADPVTGNLITLSELMRISLEYLSTEFIIMMSI